MSKIEIDLSKPEGYAHNMINLAVELGRRTGKDYDRIKKEMTNCEDKKQLVDVFIKHFGTIVKVIK
jgi:hypothetical protein